MAPTRRKQLTLSRKSDILSDMKRVNARDFQKQFGKIAESLHAGEAIQVTKHGKVLGQFAKPPSRTVPCPDFASALAKAEYPVQVGNRMLKAFNESLS